MTVRTFPEHKFAKKITYQVLEDMGVFLLSNIHYLLLHSKKLITAS